MANYWEDTVALIQPLSGPQLISKPTLKPELLQKVPFKFLHDVITAVIRKTKFAQGLYTTEQLDRKWEGFDKDAVGKDAASANKVAFLDDLHRVLEDCLQQTFDCSAKQIVRGKDPEGANRLLQNLARAGHVLALDGAAAVQKLKTKGGPPTDGTAAPPRPSSRRASKPSMAAAPEEARPMQGESDRDSAARAHDAAHDSLPTALEPVPERPSTGHGRDSGRDSARRRDASGAGARPASRQSSQQGGVQQGSVPAERVASPQGSTRQPSSPHVAGGALADFAPPDLATPSDRGGDDEAVAPARTLTAQAAARPMSAKKAPPRAPSTAEPVARRTSLRPPEQAPAMRPASRSTVRVYTEPAATNGHGDDDDDDDIDVIQESFAPAAAPGGSSHGALVSDMYAAKAAAEAGGAAPEASESLDVAGGINLGRSQRRRKASGPPAAARVDVEQLRGAVEALVQGVTPLARSMDHLQEDKENMRKELQGWRAEAEVWQACLERERGGREEGRSDSAALDALARDVVKKRAAVSLLKRQVLQNEARMAELVDVLIGDR